MSVYEYVQNNNLTKDFVDYDDNWCTYLLIILFFYFNKIYIINCNFITYKICNMKKLY